MNYTKLRFRSLVGMHKGLLDLIRAGEKCEQVFEQMAAINDELDAREWRLVGFWNNREVIEYDRYRTESEAKSAASDMGLPVGTPFEWHGRRFSVEVKPVNR